MATTSTPRTTRAPMVASALPLALLEAVRSHDRPGEVLEDEDLVQSMPRRLGLTPVINSQIKKYETAFASNRRVPLSEVLDLMRLVLRRPDAPTIMEETGRRVTRLQLGRRFSPVRSLRRLIPRAIVFASVRRAARRLLRTIAGGGAVRVTGKPLAVRIDGAPTGQMETWACQLYTGALEELIELYTGSVQRVGHVTCEARGEATCEWAAE
jgi:hypothetical protein